MIENRAEFASVDEYLLNTLTDSERNAIGLIVFNQWPFALGAVCETALAARAIGARVVLGFWSGRTPLYDAGWRANRRLARIMGTATPDDRAKQALMSAGLQAVDFAEPPLRPWHTDALPSLPEQLTRSRIRSLTYRESDMGRSILQVHPDANTPVSESHVWPRRWVTAAMKSYAWAYDQTVALVREHNLRTVVVYNGRFTHDRAVAAAARGEGARVLFYDTGGYDTDFDLTDADTHDWAHLQSRMLRMYDTWDLEERDEIGSSWFLNRQGHDDQNNKVFVERQERGYLERLPYDKRVVVFFSSSGDEIAELDLNWEEFLRSQENALLELARACRRRPQLSLVVRTHPHMRLKPSRDLTEWMAAVDQAGPAEHFGPDSPVDSYALMAAAGQVFTYGSTAGVEAAFMGRSVVVMGPSAYDLLGCARRVFSADGIGSALDDPPEPASQAAIPYGLMMQRRGFRYKRLERSTTNEPSLAGVVLSEASPRTQKLSDITRRLRTRWLTRR